VLVIGGFTLVDGNLAAVTEHLLANEPAKAAVPPLEVSTGWLSLVLTVGFGAAVSPHAIQRIYAAGSPRPQSSILTRPRKGPLFLCHRNWLALLQ
jgi:SSS family solute:Na+ symporter/sodium/pantothenate symporter